MPNRRNALYLVVILSLLGALGTGRAIFFNIAYVLIAVWLVCAVWAIAAIWGIAIGRITRSRRSQVGRTFTEQFVVRNTTFLPKLWIEVVDHSELPNHRASLVTPAIGAYSAFSWQAETLCTVRGEYRLGPIEIATGDPFGLFQPQRRIDATERVVIYPQVFPLETFHMPGGVLSGGEPQRHLTQHVTTNASSVRDYVPGDSINRIHWKSTARRSKLIVKEFELDPQVDIWLFVDFSAQSLVEDPFVQRLGQYGAIIHNGQGIPRSTEEYAAVIAASLTTHFSEQDRSLGFSAYIPHREVLQPERGQRQLVRIMESLAVARSLSQHTLYEMLSLEASSFSRGTTLIIITASLDPRWVMQAQVLTQRGIKPMCVLLDPASFGSPYSGEDFRTRLAALRIPSIMVKCGDDLTKVLSQRPI
jgi:uncharacterized protein (DUF58 family)